MKNLLPHIKGKAASALRLAVWGLGFFCLAGCSKPSAEEQASQAALSYYQRIIEGYPDGLIAAKAGKSSLPADYREQLKKGFLQYAEDIRQKHGGLKGVSISDNPARRDSIPVETGRYQQVVYTFLLLQFNDSTCEEITVPMVEKDGEWLMK